MQCTYSLLVRSIQLVPCALLKLYFVQIGQQIVWNKASPLMLSLGIALLPLKSGIGCRPMPSKGDFLKHNDLKHCD